MVSGELDSYPLAQTTVVCLTMYDRLLFYLTSSLPSSLGSLISYSRFCCYSFSPHFALQKGICFKNLMQSCWMVCYTGSSPRVFRFRILKLVFFAAATTTWCSRFPALAVLGRCSRMLADARRAVKLFVDPDLLVLALVEVCAP